MILRPFKQYLCHIRIIGGGVIMIGLVYWNPIYGHMNIGLYQESNLVWLDQADQQTWPQGYETFFMLNSVEHKIFPAHKCLHANNCWHLHIYEQEK